MVGTRGKGTKSKSKGLALVPDEPEPLNIINAEAADGEPLKIVNAEAADGPYGEEEKNEILDSGLVPVFGGRREEAQMVDGMNDEEGFGIDDMIVDGSKAALTNLDEEDRLKGVSVGVNAVSNMDVENSNKITTEEEPEKDMINVGDADVENSHERTNEEEPKADEDGHTGEEEKVSDVNACVTNANKGLAASEHVLEPVSTHAENGDEYIKENASPANEVKAVAEKLIRPKKKIIRKKLIKKKILLGKAVTAVNVAKLQPSDEKGSGVLYKAGTSNDVKPQCLQDDVTTGEASKLNNTENVKNEEEEGKPLVKKLNRIRKKKPQGQSGVQTSKVEQKPKPADDEPASKENQTIEQETKNEEAVKSRANRNRLRKRKNKKVREEGTQNVNAKDVDKLGSSKNGKLSKKIESMGMIFMCSSETKKDCYRYKVFGLPAGKKDIVSKIYKGMRLFLFDVDLKMLYGIYKAAGPGSSNIEPRAFKSQFPSQVRFSVLEDCLPIAEEKFKKVIKDNYYTRNKFDCQLNSEQVKNLCKLFHETTKKSESIRGGQSQRAVAPTRGDRKRKRTDDSRRVGPGTVSSRERERRRKGPEQVRRVHELRNQEEMRRAPVVRGQEDMGRALVVRGQEDMGRALVIRGQEETRLAPAVIDERYHHPVVVYEREAYLPPLAPSSLYQPLRAEDPPRSRIYSYERDPGVATYRRDPAIDYRDLGISAPRETRHYAERSLHDPYTIYREPHAYREPAYESATRREHYDYLSTEGRYAEYYRSDDHHPPLPYRSADYRPPLPLHRRY